MDPDYLGGSGPVSYTHLPRPVNNARAPLHRASASETNRSPAVSDAEARCNGARALLTGRGRINAETVAVVRGGGTEGVFAGGQVPDGKGTGDIAGLLSFLHINRPCNEDTPTAGLGPGPPAAFDSHQREQAVAGGVDSFGQADDEHETGGLI